MGKTRTKLIDDSQPSAEVKSQKPPKASLAKGGVKVKLEEKASHKKEEDSLVAKLREELGIEEKPKQVDTSEVESEVKDKEDTSEVGKEEKVATRSKKVQKPGKAKPRSKKYQEAVKNLDRSKYYPLPEALDTVRKMSYSKFNGTLEVHINTLQPGVRGLVLLPFAAGKKIRILVFPSGTLPEIEGVVFGDDSSLEQIEKGKVDFDLIITAPEWMPKLAKVARILGPRGLMPNPRNGTITDDLKKAVEGFQGGKHEYKTESKAPVIHLGLGKLNQPNEELEANVKTLLQSIGKTRIKKVTLSPTMGPGIKVDLSSF